MGLTTVSFVLWAHLPRHYATSSQLFRFVTKRKRTEWKVVVVVVVFTSRVIVPFRWQEDKQAREGKEKREKGKEKSLKRLMFL